MGGAGERGTRAARQQGAAGSATVLTEALDGIAATPVMRAVRGSAILYPVLNAFHIGSLGVMLGAIVTHDLAVLRGMAPAALAQRVAAWGCVLALLSGLVLFLCRGSHYLENAAFQIKAGLIAAALLNVAVAHRARQERSRKAVAALSLLLWFSVLLAGRFIGFL